MFVSLIGGCCGPCCTCSTCCTCDYGCDCGLLPVCRHCRPVRPVLPYICPLRVGTQSLDLCPLPPHLSQLSCLRSGQCAMKCPSIPHLKHLFNLLGGVQLFCLLFVCVGGMGVGGNRPIPGFAFRGGWPHTSTLCVFSPILRPFFTISSAISQLNTSSLMFPVYGGLDVQNSQNSCFNQIKLERM